MKEKIPSPESPEIGNKQVIEGAGDLVAIRNAAEQVDNQEWEDTIKLSFMRIQADIESLNTGVGGDANKESIKAEIQSIVELERLFVARGKKKEAEKLRSLYREEFEDELPKFLL